MVSCEGIPCLNRKNLRNQFSLYLPKSTTKCQSSKPLTTAETTKKKIFINGYLKLPYVTLRGSFLFSKVHTKRDFISIIEGAVSETVKFCNLL